MSELVTDQFAFDKKDKELIGELSDMGLMYFPDRVSITSSHTGKVVRFKLVNTEDHNDEPNMIGHYTAIDNVPNVKKLTIFND